MTWQEQQQRERERQAQQRIAQQCAQQEQAARRRAAQEQKILQERLDRERWQREEGDRKQREFDQKEKDRLKKQRHDLDEAIQTNMDHDREVAKPQRDKPGKRSIPFSHPQPVWPPIPTRDPIREYPFSPIGEPPVISHPPYPPGPTSSGKTPWFPFVDEWLDNFLGEPSRARKILGLFALLGLVVGAGYAELIQVAVLPYAIVGAAVGFVFLYLLKLSVKILIAAAFVGAAGLLIWALIQIGK